MASVICNIKIVSESTFGAIDCWWGLFGYQLVAVKELGFQHREFQLYD